MSCCAAPPRCCDRQNLRYYENRLFFETLQFWIYHDDALPNSNSPLFEDLRKRLRLVAGEVPALKGDGVRRIWW